MVVLIAVFTFLFGLAFGSFLNVVIYRYNTGVGINGRSACMTCARNLEWYELIPVVSFLAQGAKCRKCFAKLSWQYPFVELLTAFLFLGTYFHFIDMPFTLQTLIAMAIVLVGWCLLVVILVYDIKHKIIPDGIVYTFAALGLLRVILFVPTHPSTIFYLTLLAGPLLFLPFFILWFVSQGRWIGLGDGKLALGFGWMLGLDYGLSAIVLAFWIGAVVSIFLIAQERLNSKRKQLTMKSEIPFAPYLILGYAIVYFLSIDVMGLHTIIQYWS